MPQTNQSPCIYPTFRYRDAVKMIDWLEKAFGFTVRAKYINGGKVGHAEMAFGSSMIMLGSVQDDHYGGIIGEPGTQGGKGMYVAVDDCDALYERAKTTGAKILEPPTDRPYGSREFLCADPEGNVWGFGTYWPKADEPA